MSEQSSFRIHCRTSKDPESACRKCKGRLQEGSLQISITDSQGKKKCYDLECFVKDRAKYKFFKNGNGLPGFEDLKAADKRTVNKALPLIKDPEQTRKRKVSDLDEVEPEDQAKKKKKKKKSGMEVVDESVLMTSDDSLYSCVTPEPMNTGSFDFAVVSTQPNYIDKTMLVAQVHNASDVTLLTAPRRWGKSVGISSLKYFYQIQTKPSGEKMTGVNILEDNTLVKDTSNYLLFERTMLERVQPGVMKHLGKYPVIWIEFRGNVTNGEDALSNCREAIHYAYTEHAYLKDSKELDEGNIESFKEWCHTKKYKEKNWNDVTSSVKELSQYLRKHWGRNCVILMDEYDAITMSLLSSETLTSNEFKLIQRNMTRMLADTFKGNEFLYKGFLTGILFVPEICSELTHVDLCRFSSSHKFTKYYGLAEAEVKQLLTLNGVSNKLKSVRAFYNGYVTRRGDSYYCPWSIIKYLSDEKKRLRSYCCDSGAIFLLYESFSNPTIRKMIHELINGQAVTVSVLQDLKLQDFEDVQEFLRDPRSNSPIDVVLSMFLDQGCLTSVDVSAKPIGDTIRNLKPDVPRQLKIPNEEIRDHFRDQMFRYAKKAHASLRAELRALEESFRDIFTNVNSAKKLRAALEQFISAMEELVKAAFPDEKLINHEVIRDFLIIATFPVCPKFYPEYDVKSSDVPDGGKVDYCSIYDECGKKIALILEIKVNADTAAAKKQIIDKHYFRALDAEMLKGAQEAIIMGLCVSNPTKSQKIPWKVELIYTLRGGSPNTTETYENKTWKVVTAIPRPNE